MITSIRNGYFGALSVIIKDIYTRNQSFHEVKFIFELRETNFKTHFVAKESTGLSVGRYSGVGTIRACLVASIIFSPHVSLAQARLSLEKRELSHVVHVVWLSTMF